MFITKYNEYSSRLYLRGIWVVLVIGNLNFYIDIYEKLFFLHHGQRSSYVRKPHCFCRDSLHHVVVVKVPNSSTADRATWMRWAKPDRFSGIRYCVQCVMREKKKVNVHLRARMDSRPLVVPCISWQKRFRYTDAV